MRRRIEAQEHLDSGIGTPAEVETNLAEMWRINRYLGGFRALTQHLYPRLLACQDEVTLVDLGTGSADILVALADWARLHEIKLRCIGVDWAGRNLVVARRRIAGYPEIRLVRADANVLPYAADSVDFIVSSLFLHHVSPPQIVGLLAASFERARRGIVMTDLVRGWLPLLGFKFAQPIFARNYLTRHDGALSIRRGYTPHELLELAQAAGLPDPRMYTHFPWRMTLVVDK